MTYAFTQSAYIFLEEKPSPVDIEAMLNSHGFKPIRHEGGVDLLTAASGNGVFEIVETSGKEPLIVLLDLMDGQWPDEVQEEEPINFVSWHARAFGPFVTPGCLERALHQCRGWPQAKKVIARQTALLRLRTAYTYEMEGEDELVDKEEAHTFEQLRLITRLLVAFKDMPGLLGYFFPAGETLSSREGLAASWDEYRQNGENPNKLWPSWINVRVGTVSEEPDWMLLDVIGLAQLGMRDLEACFQHTLYPPGVVADWLLNVAFYLYENGPVIQDGHTLSGPGEINWQAQHYEGSILGPSRSVLSLRPLDKTRLPQRFTKRLN